MAEIASAFVSLLPSMRGFGSATERQIGGELDSSGKKMGGRLGSAMKVGALSVLGGAALVGTFAKDAIGEAREAQKVGALTTSIIKSTGGAAKVTAQQVGDLATAISNKTGMDDEAVQAGANLLLTFKQVRNEAGKNNAIFDRATQAAADLSAAGFGDLAGQSKMLGKALNDPVKGMSAMARSGVTFTEAQKAQVEQLVKTGDVLGAQKIILGEVESQVGGAAAASAAAGEKAAVAFGNLKEQVGTALLPAVDAAANAFLRATPAISKFIDGVGPGFSKAIGFIKPFGVAVKSVFDLVAKGDFTSQFRESFGVFEDNPVVGKVLEMRTAIGGFAADFGPRFGEAANTLKTTLLPALGALSTAFTTTILPAVASVAQAVGGGLLSVLRTAAGTFTSVVLPAVLGLASYLQSNLMPIFTQVAGIIATQVVPIIVSLAQFFYGTLYPAVIAIVTSIASKLKPVFDQLFQTIQSSVLPTVQRLLAKFREWQPTLQKIITVVVKVIGWVLNLAAAILGKVLPPLIQFAGWLIGKLVGALTTVIGWVIKVIGWIVDFGTGLVNAVKAGAEFYAGIFKWVGKVFEFVKGIPGKVVDALGDLGSTLFDAGKELIQGLLDGIKNMLPDVGGAMKGVADKIKGFLPGSPVREGPLTSWNRGAAGKRLVGLLADGLSDTGPVDAAMHRLTSGVTFPARPRLDVAPVGAGATGGHSGPMFNIERVEAQDVNHMLRELQMRRRQAADGVGR